MPRNRKGLDIHGILLLDKPAGRSSNQALQDVKRLFSARKAGHTGNLDPFATGMLPVCFGEATKTAGFMLDADKTYRATALLGVATETGDTEGKVSANAPVPDLDNAAVEAALARFVGDIQQVPPMYSALKRDGQPLYKLAREGKEVDREPRQVTIHELALENWDSPRLTFSVRCSKGTYVRTLAEDIAKSLGTCAHLVSLRRLAVSPFTEQQMVSTDQLAELRDSESQLQTLLPIDAGLVGWPRADITEGQAARFCNGNPVIIDGQEEGLVRVYGPEDKVLGIGEVKGDGQTHPKRLFLA